MSTWGRYKPVRGAYSRGLAAVRAMPLRDILNPGPRRSRAVELAAMSLTALFILLAASRLGHKIPVLLHGNAALDGVDLRSRLEETQAWFHGERIYRTRVWMLPDYPPASYLMLWPLIGWCGFEDARVIWTFVLLLSLSATSVLAWIITRDCPLPARWLAAAMPWAAFPTAYAFHYGQLGPPCLALALAAAVSMRFAKQPRPWLVAGCLALSLVKPSYSLGWLAGLPSLRGGLASLIRTVALYGSLTIAAVAAGSGPLSERLFGWIRNGMTWTDTGSGSVASLGLGAWTLPASAALLGVFAAGCWFWRPSYWTVWGIGAVVGRWFTHHNPVDDSLLLLPALLALRELATPATSRRRFIANTGAFLLATVALSLPTRLHAMGGLATRVFLLVPALAFAACLFALLLGADARGLHPRSWSAPPTDRCRVGTDSSKS